MAAVTVRANSAPAAAKIAVASASPPRARSATSRVNAATVATGSGES
ncbi:hypothetical protein OJ998_15375 [Solirubrobacter taibaiensis]|nr:hypothetical protein [Solirubrobacter taibaiensis]